MQAATRERNGGEIGVTPAPAAAATNNAIPQPRKSPKLKFDEFSVIQKACKLFDEVDEDARDRVLAYLADKYARKLTTSAARQAFLTQLGDN